MKRLLLCIACLFTLTFVSSRAAIIEVAPAGAWGIGLIGGGAVTGGGEPETACWGYPDGGTNCAYDTAAPFSSELTSTSSRTMKWTASVSGTVSRIRFYKTACPSNGNLTFTYYNGLQLRGTATATCPDDTDVWLWSDSFSSYSGRSLDFSATDTIYFGFSFEYSSDAFTFGRMADAVTPNYYSDSVYLADPWTDEISSDYETALILEYTYVP